MPALRLLVYRVREHESCACSDCGAGIHIFDLYFEAGSLRQPVCRECGDVEIGAHRIEIMREHHLG